MRIVVAPDSFKHSLPAQEVAAAIARGVRRAAPQAEIVEVPMADGGEGTTEALVRATGGELRHATVTGPLGEAVRAKFGLLGSGEAAVLEMASASGLELVRDEDRDPLTATTFGTGELIQAALATGAERLLIGIGGSATNDGGAGMAQALGYRLLDSNGEPIPRGGGGLEFLDRIEASQRDARLSHVTIEVACDVTNPLVGEQGASAVYGPQKGASPAMVERLDANLRRFAEIVRRDLGIEISDVPGAGAAGGLGAGLLAFAGATLRRGVDLVLDAVDLPSRLAGADLCITGEGAIDRSSRFGKTAVGVAAACRRLGVPVVALGGTIRDDAGPAEDLGFDAYFSVVRGPVSLEEALRSASRAAEQTAEQVMRLFLLGKAGFRPASTP